MSSINNVKNCEYSIFSKKNKGIKKTKKETKKFLALNSHLYILLSHTMIFFPFCRSGKSTALEQLKIRRNLPAHSI